MLRKHYVGTFVFAEHMQIAIQWSLLLQKHDVLKDNNCLAAAEHYLTGDHDTFAVGHRTCFLLYLLHHR